MDHAAQLPGKNPEAVITGAVPGIDLPHSCRPELLRECPDLIVVFIVQMEPSDHGQNPSARILR